MGRIGISRQGQKVSSKGGEFTGVTEPFYLNYSYWGEPFFLKICPQNQYVYYEVIIIAIII